MPLGSNKSAILVADDDETVRRLLERHLSSAGYSVVTAEDGVEAIALAEPDQDVALLDLMMPRADGLEVLSQLARDFPDTAVIMLSADGQIEDAVAAMKEGAIDYLTKPIDMEAVLAAVARGARLGRLSRENRTLKEAVGGEAPRTDFIGNSTAAQRIISDIATIAPRMSTVLITGPSGCGKTLIARQIHYSSKRSAGPFVTVSCPALPRDLLESELFGHEKGAFTGATSRRIGKIELAHGGTLFLDEIGELPLDLQPKLLNVLQDRKLHRLGGSKAIDVDIRVVAATNRDLGKEVAEGAFREDLYYRLNVIPLELPPLSERRDDVLLLSRSILERISHDHGSEPLELSAEAAAALEAAPWPGNVRQLENVLERATAFASSGIIETADLPAEVFSAARATEPPSTSDTGSLAGIALADLERMAIEQTLEHCGGSQAEAARQLGVSERTIYNKLKKFSSPP